MPKQKAMGEEILKDFMLKRAMSRSALFTSENYKDRWFILTSESLSYYTGTLAVSMAGLVIHGSRVQISPGSTKHDD